MSGRNLKSEHCRKGFDEEQISKAILNQFMRQRNLMNVAFVVKYLMKNKTSKALLYQFMRGRNLMNVTIVVKY